MFIEEYLDEVRRERFAPPAMARYLRRVAAAARESMLANTSAVRSIWNVALGFFAAAFLASVAMAVAYDRRLAYDFFLRTALWILPAFAFVTLYVELLRDENGYRLSAINVPTVLTLMRVILVPGIILFLLRGHYALAVVVFLVAVLSDVADGWLARRWNQITKLGIVLDPLVDIVFNLALFAGLVMARLVPGWMFGVAALRYGILLVGGACFYVFIGPVRIRPTLFGRMTGVVTSALAGLLMLLHAPVAERASALIPLTRIALGVLLSATVAHVVVLGWYNLRVMHGHSRARGRVVGDVRWGAQ